MRAAPTFCGLETRTAYVRGWGLDYRDHAQDGYSGVRQKHRTDQQQTQETEKEVQGPKVGSLAKGQWSATEKSPFQPSRLSPWRQAGMPSD